MKYIRRFLQFIKTEVWLLETSRYHPVLGFLIRQLRIILISSKGFRDNRIQLRASALTYYSLLSIVPVAAMVFGIAKGFGFEARLDSELRKMISEREDELLRLMAEGLTNREIGARLYLAEKTVKNQLTQTFRRIGVRNRTEAALWAILVTRPVNDVSG